MLNIADTSNKVEITEEQMRLIQNALYTERYNFKQHKGDYSDEKVNEIEELLDKLAKLEF